MDKHLILFIAIGIMQIITVWGFFHILQDMALDLHKQRETLEDWTHTQESIMLKDPGNYRKTRLNGIYYESGYYCVWVEGRENDTASIDPYLSDIQETAIHEACHAMIHADYEHFCGE